MSKPKHLAIVIPIHNEEQNIVPLVNRIEASIARLTNYSCELLFVDDGSVDNSVIKVKELMEQTLSASVTLVSLARNFGHQAALEAGLANTNADVVITMDGDQQHPPEYIPAMVAAYEQGAEVVQMKRQNSVEDLKSMLAITYYKFFNLVSPYPIVVNAADFRLMNKAVVQAILRIRIRGKYLRVLIPALGFKQVNMEYIQEKRTLGKPSYNYYSLYLLAHYMLFKYTRFPIHVIMILGSFLLSVGILLSGYVGVSALLEGIGTSATNCIAPAFLFTLTGSLLVGVSILSWYIFFLIEQLRQDVDYIVSTVTSSNDPK